ncbi:unnamed protein product [Vitrella brassicaformis CCMP3155]|uniref:J domain-containing protein n=1 Tax=Vitrella brassicaformis (strain CCMP3155) TaxID=1169540 RepID=A0A0G4GR96_VITBC|nr:unnamed protein product [Vitrella brassicaformis CCMP3155]|mmetsp:Transcript_29442/g.73302  ORF Transcript_29442/g.73302 Transcript_29442/m.73302 type:complete len:213 (-) Transcript_29442:637-1275(-)|eukprot:CEM33050.1 unnamed protein product [Vitrella brassicaformis CCMP3155]
MRGLFRLSRTLFDHYRVLGVARDANKAKIRSAYLEKAKIYHPDVNKSREAEAIFKQVQEAYSVLSDDTMRKDYDVSSGLRTEDGFRGTGPGPTSSAFAEAYQRQYERMRRERQAENENFWNRQRQRMEEKYGGSYRRPYDPYWMFNPDLASRVVRMIPLILIPLLVLSWFARSGNRHRLSDLRMEYDQLGRAWLVDSFGRAHRAPNYDIRKA